MKFKKIILILILTSMIIPCIFIPFSNAEIEWQVSEGDKYSWIVKTSNETLGLLPVNSLFEMTITSIKSVSSTATELYANFSEYDSVTELTTTILTNQTFSSFDSSTNTTSLYKYISEHCFLIPPTYVDGFTQGLESFYSPFFDLTGSLTAYGVYSFFGVIYGPIDYLYTWIFNGNYKADNLVIVDMAYPEDFLYWVVLQTSSNAIPAGYFFLIFFGFTTISLIYIFSKKLKVKS